MTTCGGGLGRVGTLLLAAVGTILSTAAAAEPLRLGEVELGTVAIDETDVRAAKLARDWLEGGFWQYEPHLTRRLDPTLALRSSRPSRPQAAQPVDPAAIVE